MNNDREYRSFNLIERAKTEEHEYIVEGYASTFEPYMLYKDEKGNEVWEQVARDAFDKADFSDCVFRVDHEGPVYARTSAGTVQTDINDNGLHTITDLSKTQRGRDLYEDIAAGNYPQMSFAFTIAEQHRDKNKVIIDRIEKVFDIAAVTWPANPTTSLSARSKELIDGAIEELEAERLRKERCEKAMERINKFINKENSHE